MEIEKRYLQLQAYTLVLVNINNRNFQVYFSSFIVVMDQTIVNKTFDVANISGDLNIEYKF